MASVVKAARWATPILCFFILQSSIPAGAGENSPESFILGVKIYDYAGSFPDLFEEWRSLGINTAFVSKTLASNPEFRDLARKNRVAIFIILPIFFNAEELEKRPDLYAITNRGEKAVDDWVKFVCPAREDYRREKIDEVKKLVTELDPEGISLDFIRSFVFWEMVYPERTLSSIANACFCPTCLEGFQLAAKIKIPGNLSDVSEKASWILKNHLQAWTEWKCLTVSSMVKSLAEEARKTKPGIKVNVHLVPWRKDDFGGAVRIIAGQDQSEIAAYTDYLSPMCYHHMVKREPAWIHSVTEDVYSVTRGQVVPSIQVKEAYLTEILSVPEFKEALAESLKPPSRGVIFWNWDTLEKSPEKRDAIKTILKLRD